MNFKLICYSTSSKGEVRLKQDFSTGLYKLENNSNFIHGTLKDVWPEFRIAKGPQIRYVGSYRD